MYSIKRGERISFQRAGIWFLHRYIGVDPCVKLNMLVQTRSHWIPSRSRRKKKTFYGLSLQVQHSTVIVQYISMSAVVLILPLHSSYAAYSQSWACGAEERKSASPQVFFVAPQCKLRFSKVQSCSLHFKLLDAIFNCYFYEWIWYSKF
jgi:hypothetical protein